MQNGNNLPPGNVIDLSSLRKRPDERELTEEEKIRSSVFLAAAAQKPDGQFTMLKADADSSVLLSEESIERIAQRVVELLRPGKH